jgi:hypothetical protein
MTYNRLVVFSGYSVAICDKVCQWLILLRSTQRKPPTCCKSLTNFITYCHGVPRENHQPVASHWQTWSHIAMEYPEKTTNLFVNDLQQVGGFLWVLRGNMWSSLSMTYNRLVVFSGYSITYCHGVPRENHQPVVSHWQTWSHIAMEYPEKTTNLLQACDRLVVFSGYSVAICDKVC